VRACHYPCQREVEGSHSAPFGRNRAHGLFGRDGRRGRRHGGGPAWGRRRPAGPGGGWSGASLAHPAIEIRVHKSSLLRTAAGRRCCCCRRFSGAEAPRQAATGHAPAPSNFHPLFHRQLPLSKPTPPRRESAPPTTQVFVSSMVIQKKEKANKVGNSRSRRRESCADPGASKGPVSAAPVFRRDPTL
jgi:hypothetical protein